MPLRSRGPHRMCECPDSSLWSCVVIERSLPVCLRLAFIIACKRRRLRHALIRSTLLLLTQARLHGSLQHGSHTKDTVQKSTWLGSGVSVLQAACPDTLRFINDHCGSQNFARVHSSLRIIWMALPSQHLFFHATQLYGYDCICKTITWKRQPRRRKQDNLWGNIPNV